MTAVLTIDDELYARVQEIAAARLLPVDIVMAELLRTGLEASTVSVGERNGLPIFIAPPGAKQFGLDEVRAAEDEP